MSRYGQMDRETLERSCDRMDRWFDNLAEWVQANITCPYCHAAPGEPCMTANGVKAGLRHGARWNAMREIRGDWDE